jgi:Putative Ig domain
VAVINSPGYWRGKEHLRVGARRSCIPALLAMLWATAGCGGLPQAPKSTQNSNSTVSSPTASTPPASTSPAPAPTANSAGLRILTVSVPQAIAAQPYSTDLSAAGGVPPYTWKLSRRSAALPSGMTLESSGTISGNPVSAGNFSILVEVSDSASQTTVQMLALNVLGDLTITMAALPQATNSQPYSVLLRASGGQPPYIWSVARGSHGLPPGLSLLPSGTLAGKTSAVGTFQVVVQVSDASSPRAQTATGSYDFSVGTASSDSAGDLTVTVSSLPDATSSQPYSATLTAAGGGSPYTWQVAPNSGSLPAGLALDSSGNVTGTPLQAGPSVFSARVTDAMGSSATALIHVNVISPSGNTYYVDSISGDDTNSGASASSAWASLAKVSAVHFSPGDQVLLRRGAVWREQLTVPSSGTPANPIVFGAYGDGAAPVVTGADVIANWTGLSGFIYRAPVSWAPAHVWQAGTLLKHVSALSGLTSPGQWFYDSGSQSLDLWPVSGTDPNQQTVDADHRNRAFDIVGKSYVTMEDLSLMNSTSELIAVWSGSHISVLNCDLKNALQVAVDVSSTSPGFTIDHSSYSVDPGYTGRGFLSVHSTAADGPIVSNNTVGNFGGPIAIAFDDVNNPQAFGNTIVGNGISIAFNGTTRSVSGLDLHDNFISSCDSSFGDGECIEFTGHASPLFTATGRAYRNFIQGGPHSFGGIDGWHAVNSSVYGNIVTNMTSWGIEWTADSTGNSFYNNTIYNTGVGGMAFYSASGTGSATVKNNIIARIRQIGISADSNSRVSEDYNLLDPTAAARSPGIAAGLHTLLAEPLFASSSPSTAADFRLQPGSPAVDSGLNLGQPYNTLFDPESTNFPFSVMNVNLSAAGWDRGAYGHP